jgi:hypothetical protein
MRIAFTYNVKPKASGADSGDRYAEWEDEATIVAVEAALSRAGNVIRVEANDDLPLRLHDLRPDMVFNIAEGIGGPNREAHVPAICEFWSTPYTGSDSMTMSLCLDKGRAKEVLAHHGIATAPFAVSSIDRTDLRGGNVVFRWVRDLAPGSNLSFQAYYELRAAQFIGRLRWGQELS